MIFHDVTFFLEKNCGGEISEMRPMSAKGNQLRPEGSVFFRSHIILMINTALLNDAAFFEFLWLCVDGMLKLLIGKRTNEIDLPALDFETGRKYFQR